MGIGQAPRMKPRRVAVVGGGWAGMAAAVTLAQATPDLAITVFEAGRVLGGRARRVTVAGQVGWDNGQHLLIGAYHRSLALMHTVGVNPDTALLRLPQRLEMAGEFCLQLPRLPAPFNQICGLLHARGLTWAERGHWLRALLALKRVNYRLPVDESVAHWLARQQQPARLIRLFWEPVTLATLNTPLACASMQVLATVLREGVAGAARDSDMLIPRVDLSALFPEPAAAWLTAQGHTVQCGTRVPALDLTAAGVTVNGQPFDAVVMATAPQHLAALLPTTEAWAAWQGPLHALRYQPIATVYLQADHPDALGAPLVGLANGAVQWVFNRQAVCGHAGQLAAVISVPAAEWLADLPALHAHAEGVLCATFPALGRVTALKTVVEKRATFSCEVGLTRLAATSPDPRVVVAGDHVAGSYPATLEGAVQSGEQAARRVLGTLDLVA